MAYLEWDLWRHRTEPVTVVLQPARILFDNDASDWFDETDAAEREIQRRESGMIATETVFHRG